MTTIREILDGTIVLGDGEHEIAVRAAELENLPREMAARVWPLEERSLNLWGPGWIRD